MKLDHDVINTKQFAFTIGCFLGGTTLLTGFFVSLAKQDSWLVVLAGTLVALPVIYVLHVLVQKFPGKNLFEINEIVFGRWLGKFISLLYLLFFLTLCALNLSDMGDFTVNYIMKDTPRLAIMLPFLAVCAWAVRKGLAVVIRYSVSFVALLAAITALSILLTVDQMDLRNFLPMLTLPPMDYVKATSIIAMIPLGEAVVVMMIASNVKNYDKTKFPPYFTGVFIGAASTLLSVMRDTLVLGDTQTLFSVPSFETLRQINIADVLSRMEVLFALGLNIVLFFKISLLFYAVARGTAQIFELKTYRPLVTIIGALILIYALIMFDSPAEHLASVHTVVPQIWMIVQVAFPVITLVVAAIRKFPAGREQQEGVQAS